MLYITTSQKKSLCLILHKLLVVLFCLLGAVAPQFALFGLSACEIKDFFAPFALRFSRNGGLERFRAVRQSSTLCRHALTHFMPSLCSAGASHYASLCSGYAFAPVGISLVFAFAIAVAQKLDYPTSQS